MNSLDSDYNATVLLRICYPPAISPRGLWTAAAPVVATRISSNLALRPGGLHAQSCLPRLPDGSGDQSLDKVSVAN